MKLGMPVQAARGLACRGLQKVRTQEPQVEISCLVETRVRGFFTPL